MSSVPDVPAPPPPAERGEAPALVPTYAAGPVLPEELVSRLVPVSMIAVVATPVVSNASTTPRNVPVPVPPPRAVRYTLYRTGVALSGMFGGAATASDTDPVGPVTAGDTSTEATTSPNRGITAATW